MKLIISESQLKKIVLEQTAGEAEKAASDPQKCGITTALDKENRAANREGNKEMNAWSKEVARQDKQNEKDRILTNKNFMSLSFDRDSFPLEKNERKVYYSQYQDFMNTNPTMLSDSEGFNSQQKYAIVTKVLDFVKKVPQISYTVNLKSKFNLTPNSGVNDMVNVINQMGGWSSFMNWFNSGGPKIK